MTTINRPNRNALNEAIDIYRDAMRQFIVRNLRKVRGGKVEDHLCSALQKKETQIRAQIKPDRSNLDELFDVNDMPRIVRRFWRDGFKSAFSNPQGVEAILHIVADARNKAAHPGGEDISAATAETGFENMIDVLSRINAPDESRAVERIRERLQAGPEPQLMPQPDTSATMPAAPPPQPAPTPRAKSAGLAAWREVLEPNDDVRSGAFQQAEFAADLQEVYDGSAKEAYGNPVAFFNQTYVTPGLRTLLVSTLKRLAGEGGDPVIQTKTGFGGGKTHSLIALYHLVNSPRALLDLPGDDAYTRTRDELRSITNEAGVSTEMLSDNIAVSVLSGSFLSPTDRNTTSGGDPLNTLWGQMAWQLGGQEAYEIVGEAARQGTAPGGRQLGDLLNHVGPCVVLIDELVAYARNAGEMQDSVLTFIQALTESVRRSRNAVLVITLPESAQEAGGEGGQDALDRLDHLLGRIEAVWQPLEVREAFEVVRRRLFASAINEAERDRTCKAFADMYSRQRSDYPREAGERSYLERMKQCYPIHPEIFDRLYEDWSSIHRFQRTRGVLRMMANCISRLWLEGDAAPLIMPGDFPLSDPALAGEFTPLLDGNWSPVLSEVDSDDSQADRLDREQSRFGDVGGAARRITRTVLLGSAPGRAIRGINDERIRLGVVQPGHGVSVYNDALGRLSQQLYYMYSSDGRYYFHAEENLNKVADDRAQGLDDREIDEELVRRLGKAVGRRGDVIVCPDPNDRAAVPEGEQVRLVVLSPGDALPSRAQETDRAEETALRILQWRGDAPRVRKNFVVFLAAKQDEIRHARRETRRYLAWDSILHGERRLDTLHGDRQQQAMDSLRSADRAVEAALVRAWRWALAPSQADPQRAAYTLSQFDCDPSGDGSIVDAAFRKLREEEAVVEEISANALATMLEQRIWANDVYGDHIAVDALWDLLANNVYLHRLRNLSVLYAAIDAGVQAGAFGHGSAYDSDTQTYADPALRRPIRDDYVADELRGVIVRREVIERQLAAQQEPTKTDGKQGETDDPQPGGGTPPTPPPAEYGPTRVSARKTLHGTISLDEMSALESEIVRNLSDGDAEVTITIAIEARNSAGFSQNLLSAVRQNCEQLGAEFELPWEFKS